MHGLRQSRDFDDKIKEKETLIMLEKFLIEVPQEIAEKARIAAEETGQTIEQVLSKWVVLSAPNEIDTYFPRGTVHHIYTPFGMEEAAVALRAFMEEHQKAKVTGD